jgi:hypothetical protein
MALKTILIYTEDIKPGMKWMLDKQGRMDLLGQILYTGYGIKVHPMIESPAHQGTLLTPFTVVARNRVHNTALTIALLKNGEILSGIKQVEQANILLDEHCIVLEKA